MLRFPSLTFPFSQLLPFLANSLCSSTSSSFPTSFCILWLCSTLVAFIPFPFFSFPSAGHVTMQQPAGTAAFASHNCPKRSRMLSLSHLEFSEISFLIFFFGFSLRCSPFPVCFAFFCLFIWLSGERFSCVCGKWIFHSIVSALERRQPFYSGKNIAVA